MRRDDVDAGVSPPQFVRDGLLVGRIAEREEQADGDCLRGGEVGQRVEVERLELSLAADPTTNAGTAIQRDERLRMLGAEAVEGRTRLPAAMEEGLETGRAHGRRAGAAPVGE